jgi:hemerythrin superfamily protein
VSALADAYSGTGGGWEQGPARVYERLASVLIDRSPVADRVMRSGQPGALRPDDSRDLCKWLTPPLRSERGPFLARRGRVPNALVEQAAVWTPAVAPLPAVPLHERHEGEQAMSAADTRTEDIVDLLLSQHNDVRSLFGQIQGAMGKARKDAFQRLVNLLAVHETAEEMVVYPAVRSTGPDGDRLADARTAEESEAKEALADLERTDVSSPEFDAKLQAFEQLVDAHARNEEQEIFPLLRESQSPDQLARMADALHAAEGVAPTHPHPHGPETAVGNLLVGPFVGVVDRVRDALRGRSRRR